MPSAPLHLLIADAASPAGEGGWPALDALLARMRPAGGIEAEDGCPATPLEIALARAHHLPGEPGRVPWAAFESGIVGTPCAWLRPCHWQLGMDHARLMGGDELALTEAESRALLAAAQPLLADDGVTIGYAQPGAWLARGELLRGLRVWSLRRALQHPSTGSRRGPVMRDMLPQAPARLRRLQSELEMLLHDHPVNAARENAGRPTVNALWIDGAGALDALPPPNARVLIEPALPGDGGLAQLRRALDGGDDARLTLCGPRRALAFAPARGLRDKISNLFSPQRFRSLRDKL